VANREALLVAAAATLAESSDASLEAIAQTAGLSRRAVYGHFANRDELVHALIDRGAERLNETASAVDHDDPVVAIALLGARLWDDVEHVRLLAAMAVREPFVHHVGDALEPVRARLRQLVGRGRAAGGVRLDIPAGVLGHLIERSALAVLGEAAEPARTGAASAPSHADTDGAAEIDPRRLVMLAVLSTAGLSWRDAGALVDATPELAPTPADRGSTHAPTPMPTPSPTSEGRTP
jgi:AcrR family transcriptional regulator